MQRCWRLKTSSNTAGFSRCVKKGLDGIDRGTAAVTPGGTLAHDREFALFDADGEVLNGKRTDRIHDLDTGFDPETADLTVELDGEREQFDLENEPDRASEWFVERREATFPDWADAEAFEHFYTLMLIARIPETDRGGEISVGDEIRIVE